MKNYELFMFMNSGIMLASRKQIWELSRNSLDEV